jgi:hypothetical protein
MLGQTRCIFHPKEEKKQKKNEGKQEEISPS